MRRSLLAERIPDIRIYYGCSIPEDLAKTYGITDRRISSIMRIRNGTLKNPAFINSMEEFIKTIPVVTKEFLHKYLPSGLFIKKDWELKELENSFKCFNYVEVENGISIEFYYNVPKRNPSESNVHFRNKHRLVQEKDLRPILMGLFFSVVCIWENQK
jgi:hypothetical protein